MRRTISVLTGKLIHLFQSESKILATEHVFAQSGRGMEAHAHVGWVEE